MKKSEFVVSVVLTNAVGSDGDVVRTVVVRAVDKRTAAEDAVRQMLRVNGQYGYCLPIYVHEMVEGLQFLSPAV